MKRELKEEVGLETKIISPISVWDYENTHKEIQYVEVDFLCTTIDDSEVKLSDEHSDFAWVTFYDLGKYEISEPALKVFENLKIHPLVQSYLGA